MFGNLCPLSRQSILGLLQFLRRGVAGRETLLQCVQPVLRQPILWHQVAEPACLRKSGSSHELTTRSEQPRLIVLREGLDDQAAPETALLCSQPAVADIPSLPSIQLRSLPFVSSSELIVENCLQRTAMRPLFSSFLKGAGVTLGSTVLSCGLAIQIEKSAHRLLYHCKPEWYATVEQAHGLTPDELAYAKTLQRQAEQNRAVVVVPQESLIACSMTG